MLSTFAGRGDGTFGTRQDLPAAFDRQSMAVGDFNLDERPDLALTYSSARDTLSIFLNTTAPPDTIPPTITAAATPSVLWPPNGKTVSVVVSGTVVDEGSVFVDPTSVRFAVNDEYGRVQPRGDVTIDADGKYSQVVRLVASRRHDARTYKIFIRAQDHAGNSASARVIVIVPHDRRGKPHHDRGSGGSHRRDPSDP